MSSSLASSSLPPPTVDRMSFAGLAAAAKYYWSKNYVQKFTIYHHVFNVGAFVLVCGNLSHIYSKLHGAWKFTDLMLNIAYLNAHLFFVYALYIFMISGRDGDALLSRREWNNLLTYSREQTLQIIRVHNWIVAVLVGGVGCMVVIGMIWFEFCNVNDPGHVCVFMPSNLGVDLNKRPFRELYNILFIYVHGYGTLAVILMITFMHIVTMTTELGCTKFELMLDEVKRPNDKIRRLRLLKDSCVFQKSTLETWNILARIYQWPLMVAYIIGGTNIGLITIILLTKFDPLAFVYGATIIFSTMAFGFLAEEMKKHSERLRQATFYACPWDGDVQTVRVLMLMNLYLHDIFKLPIGNYAYMSNELVLMVFQGAYSLINFYKSIHG